MAVLMGGRYDSLLERLKQQVCACDEQNQQTLVLVPEQYTLEAERQLLDYARKPGFFNVQVVSPTRLAKRVLNEMSPSSLRALDEFGLRMAMAQAVTKVKKKLKYYAHGADQPGFIQKLCSLISDFKQSGLTPDELMLLARDKGLMMNRDKLDDICLIWQAYEGILSGRFQDGQDRQYAVAKRLRELRLYAGWQVFVYGFDTVTGSLGEVLVALAEQANGLTVMLNCLEKPEMYHPVRKSMSRFAAKCSENGIPVKSEYLPDCGSSRIEAIDYLQKNLFLPKAKPYSGKDNYTNNIRIVSAASPYLEVKYVAEKILEKNRAGVPFERMTVVAGHLSDYAPLISALFSQCGIPSYLEEGLPVATHPLCRFLISALNAAGGNYKGMTVLLKSGFVPITGDEAFLLENYCLAYGIKGTKWVRQFTLGADAEQAEALRLRVMEPILRLESELKTACTAPDSLRAIIHLLEDCNAYQTLLQQEEKLLAAGMDGAADRNRQVWAFLMNLLDQMAVLFGDTPIPCKSVANWLLDGISSAQLGTLPPRPGQVTVGEMGHTLARSSEIAFLIGLQADILLKDTQSLITDEERDNVESLLGAAVSVGLTDDLRGSLARADFVRTVALAEKELYLTWAQANLSGAGLSPLSALNNGVTILLPALKGTTVNLLRMTDLPVPISAADALSDVGVRLRNAAKDGSNRMDRNDSTDNCWRAIVKALSENPETCSAMNILWDDLCRKSEILLSGTTAEKLYRQDTVSVSRLETYAGCPYQFFVKYGLRPKDRPEWKVSSIEEGNFYHAVLCNFAELVNREKDFWNLPQEQLTSLFDMAAEEPLRHEDMRPMHESVRTKAGLDWMLRNARRAAWLYVEHARESSFRTIAQEQWFGRNGMPPIKLILKDGSIVCVEGKIDRIDVWNNEADGKRYVRVIDYKSGNHSIDAAKVWFGIQLQLLLYLSTAEAAAPDTVAAGAFYFHVDDPLVTLSSAKAAAEDQLKSKLKLAGVFLSDDTVVEALGKGSIKLSQDHSNAVTEPEMKSLLCLARNRATEAAEGIHSGSIHVEPQEVNGSDPCKYCEFSSLCQVEKRGRKQRRKKMQFSELKERAGTAGV